MSSGRPRVLICEDDADVGKLLQIMVDKVGCDSDLAGSAAEAKALLRERRNAAITLDLMLRDLGGLEVLQALKGDLATRDIPVVVLTSRTNDDMSLPISR